MKRYLFFLICLLVSLALMACQHNDTPGITTDTTANTTQSATDTTGTTKTTDATKATNETDSTDTTQTTVTEEVTLPSQEPPTGTGTQTNTQPQKPTQGNTEQPNQGSTEPTVSPGPKIIAEGKCLGVSAKWKLTEDGTLTIYGRAKLQNQREETYAWSKYADQVKKVVVEEGITNIPKHAFYSHKNLTEVVLADSVDTIGEQAFSGCLALSKITIPPKVTQLEEGVFTSCNSLTSINFAPDSQLHTINASIFVGSGLKEFIAPPNLKIIKSRAFIDASELETVILNDALETLEPQAFTDCNSLNKVVMGTGKIDLGNANFSDCPSITYYESYRNKHITLKNRQHLETVIIGGNYKSIPTFTHCTSLKNVTITCPIDRIADGQFMGCKSLVSITIPETVTMIENYAFVGSGIQEVTIPPNVTSMGVCVFNKTPLQKITFTGDPPGFVSNNSECTFTGLDKLTAYYPADNPLWTEAILTRNFGAEEITWIAK